MGIGIGLGLGLGLVVGVRVRGLVDDLLDPGGAVLHERILEGANALVELALLG